MDEELKAYIDHHVGAAVQREVEPLLRKTIASLIAHLEAVEMRNIERFDRLEARFDQLDARMQKPRSAHGEPRSAHRGPRCSGEHH
jgi:hypothetical protein